MEERVKKVTDKERVTAALCGPDPPVKVVRTNCINNLLYAAYSEFGCLFIDSLHVMARQAPKSITYRLSISRA